MKIKTDEDFEKLKAKIAEIDKTFKPSTTFEQGELIKTDYDNWKRIIQPAQEEDWNRIRKLLRGYWTRLQWQYRGWIFNHFRAKYNWSGWSIEDGVALTLALQK